MLRPGLEHEFTSKNMLITCLAGVRISPGLPLHVENTSPNFLRVRASVIRDEAEARKLADQHYKCARLKLYIIEVDSN